MNQLSSRMLLAGVVAVVAAGTAPAQFSPFEFNYSVAGLSGTPSSIPATGLPSGLTATDLTRVGLTAQPATNRFSSSGFSTAASVSPQTDGYLTFTINPGIGTLNLDGLLFTVSRDTNGPQSISVRSSLDSFGSSVGSLSLPTVNDPTTLNIDNLGAAYDALTAAVEFRLYGFNAASGAGLLQLRGGSDAVIATGQFNPVPEPATVGLLATAGLGLVGFVRRRLA